MSTTNARLPLTPAARLFTALFGLAAILYMGSHWLGFYSWCRSAFGMAILQSCGIGG